LTVTFIEQSCLPYLTGTQNEDGGWGFKPGTTSRVEPTAWALLALQEYFSAGSSEKSVAGGLHFLKASQLPDGSWPAAPAQRTGSWVTSVACWALLANPQSKHMLERGLHWLSNEWPGDSTKWWRFVRTLTAGRSKTGQNDSYSGWSWTPGTSSWVEPTSYAIIVLRSRAKSLPAKARRRLQVAKAMLFDRMCPGGGWNSGNPVVYGVAGEAQIDPTVWALLALQGDAGQAKIQLSLDWLERQAVGLQSPGSMALTYVALGAYGRTASAANLSPRICDQKNELLWNVPVVAWTVLTASSKKNWLAVTRPEKETA
jgi:Prenyltransferase and squalene oxidase repeat